jgi:hypothetical protein
MTDASPSNPASGGKNPPQSPFCLSLTGKRGRLLLPFVKGGAAVQSLNTHASEAVGLWRRTVGRDLRKLFSEQFFHLAGVKMTQNRIGSVMVVGGGIAGMQSALDLANSGYYVYLVERSSSIGGVMSQLDKTFPTNDCSM